MTALRRASLLILPAAASLAAAFAGEQPVRLEWRPAAQRVVTGSDVSIGLFAVSDRPVSSAAARVILAWDPAALELLGTTEAPGRWAQSGLVEDDPWGINEIIPPADGDGVWDAFAPLGQPVPVDTAGVRLTTFEFRAAAVGLTQVEVLLQAGQPSTDTVVLDATVPNFNLLGDLGSPAAVQIVACLGDLDGDGATGFSDLVALLAAFGNSPADDLDADGDTDFADLVLLLGDYGCNL